MFTLTDSFFYREPLRVKTVHILPQIGETEDFDVEWEFQQATGGGGSDVFGIGDISGEDIGGAAGGGGKGKGDEEDLDKLIKKYEEYLRKEEEVRRRQVDALEELGKTFLSLHRVALEFGDALGNLAKLTGEVVYTLSPTLGGLSRGLSSFVQELGGVGKGIGAVSSGISSTIEAFQKAARSALEFQLRFPLGPPSLPTGGGGAGANIPAGATLPTGGITGAVLNLIPQVERLSASFNQLGAAIGNLSPRMLIAIAVVVRFAQALQMLISIVQSLMRVLDNIVQLIERGTQMVSVWERMRLGFSQFIESAGEGERAWNRFLSMFSRFGLTMEALTQTLQNALGNIATMAAQGRVSLEEWARLMGEFGRLGIRADQIRPTLQAVFEGQLMGAAGVGIPIETVESIAMLTVGVAGLGETATRAAVAMNLIQMQINTMYRGMSEEARRAGEAIRAYNQIVGQLQQLYGEAGRALMSHFVEPLQVFAQFLERSGIKDAIMVVVEAIGSFGEYFLYALQPFFEEIKELIRNRAADIQDWARGMGQILGDALGMGLRAIIDFVTNPFTQAGLAGLAIFFNGLVDLLSGFVRTVGPFVTLALGAIGTILGGIVKVAGFFLNWIATIAENIVPFIARFFRRREEEIPVDPFKIAMFDLSIALTDATSKFQILKRVLEGVASESRVWAENLQRTQKVMQDLSILFTPTGMGAMWAPFQEFFRAMFQAAHFPARVREGLIRAGAIRGEGIEELVEFRIPRIEPIPVGYVTWGAMQLQAALRQIDAQWTSIMAAVRTFSREMAGIGYTLRVNILQEYEKLAQAFRNLASQMEAINRQMQEMVRGLREAYQLMDTFLRLRWGAEDLAQVATITNNLAMVSERILLLTRYRAEAQAIEVERAARFLALQTAIARERAAALRREGIDIGIAPEQIDLFRMAPQQIALLYTQLGLPYFMLNQAIAAQRQLLEAQRQFFEEWRRGADEIANTAANFRSFQESVRDAAARFGDFIGTTLSGIQALRSFDQTLQGLAIRAAAAIATSRWDEYFRTLQDAWNAFVTRFERSIELIRRQLEAAFAPLNLFLDRLSIFGNMLERVGAQALILPQVFNQAIPAALQYLQVLMQMAEQYRNHPYYLNAILQEAERVYSRIMGMIGQAGAIVPAIPLSELTRIAQMPVFAVREMVRWAREGAPPPFAPIPQMMGIPVTQTWLIGARYQFGMGYLAESDVARFMMAPFQLYARYGAQMTVADIRAQMQRDYEQFIRGPFRGWMADVEGLRQVMTAELQQRIGWAFGGGLAAAQLGLGMQRVPLPGLPLEQAPRLVEVPPQAMQLPVRLRLELENDTIQLNVRIRSEATGEERTVTRRIKVTPITPEDIIRRNPSTTGT